jgi:hypothetical protein
MRIWIQIRIEGAKPVRIYANPSPDPGQNLPSEKLNFMLVKGRKIHPTYVGPGLFVKFWFNLLAPRFGYRRAKSMRIRIHNTVNKSH